MRSIFGVALVALCACGGNEEGDATERGEVAAWGLGDAGRSDASIDEVAPSCDTLVVFAVDRVAAAELAFGADGGPDLPNLASLARGAVVVPDAIAASTSGNAAIASLLTGLHPTEHGIGTLRTPGRAKLEGDVTTIAESLADEDWRTVASFSSPRAARGFAGFAQGFADYAAPRIGERPRDAATVVLGARDPLDAALASDRKVFALYVFDGPGGRNDALELDPALVAPHVVRRLAPLRAQNADVDAALQRMDGEPADALGDLAKRLRRSRGSDIANAWARALRDAKLAAIDAAVGEVLERLEDAGRAERAMVVVTGLRGDRLPGPTREAGARLGPEATSVPLVLRAPHGAAVPLPDGPVGAVEVPRRLARWFGAEGLPTPEPGTAFVVDGRFGTSTTVTRDALVERYDDGTIVAFDRAGAALATPLENDAPTAAARLVESRFALDVDGAPAGTRLRWEVSEGRVLTPRGEGLGDVRPGVRGTIALGGAVELPLSHRSSSIWLELMTDGAPALELTSIGGTAITELPVMFVPIDDGAPLAADAERVLRIDRANGLWWTMTVAAEGEVEVLATVWPPREPFDEVEVSAGGAVVAHEVPGRRDLVRLVGEGPFDLRIKKLSKEDFAVACRVGGEFVDPAKMSFRGDAWATAERVAFTLHDWQPRFSEGLVSVDDALYAAAHDDARTISITRVAPGEAPPADAFLEFDQLEFVKTLLPGE